MTAKEKFLDLLTSVERPGIDKLIEYLEHNGFFESPASTRFHSCYPGGLVKHSLRVYELLSTYNKDFKFDVPEQMLIVAGLLHDVCKVGAYLGTEGNYRRNRAQPKGHARLSIERIEQYITLLSLEELMIKFHMGVYGLAEFDERKGEYSLRGGSMANAWHHHPIVKVMYFCDELASFEEKVSVNE